MKTAGICTDVEALKILKDQYKENSSKCCLDRLNGKDFQAYLVQAYDDDTSIYKASSR